MTNNNVSLADHLSNARNVRESSINGDQKATAEFSTKQTQPLSDRKKELMIEILQYLPNLEDLKVSVRSVHETKIFTSTQARIAAAKAKILLYGPPSNGKTILVLTACAATKRYPYIVPITDFLDAEIRGALGYMLAMEDRFSPVLIVTNCEKIDDVYYGFINSVANKNKKASVVGIASGLPVDIEKVKLMFPERHNVETIKGLVGQDIARYIIVQEDITNQIFKNNAGYMPVIINLCQGMTLGTVTSAYRNAISETMDVLVTLNRVGQITYSYDPDLGKTPSDKIETFVDVDDDAKECFVLAFLQALFLTPLYKEEGYIDYT